jgi:hypothetical protein
MAVAGHVSTSFTETKSHPATTHTFPAWMRWIVIRVGPHEKIFTQKQKGKLNRKIGTNKLS